MGDFSPDTEAVAEAYAEHADPYSYDVLPLAAALRAAADQILPASPEMDDKLLMVRYRLCAIADELEAQ